MINEKPKETWENVFVQMSHKLISELVDDPFMLTRIEENFFNKGPAVINQCFYATVVYLESCTLVFHNEAGGMCPIDTDYLHKKYSSINSLGEGVDFKSMFNDLKEEISQHQNQQK